MSTAAAAVASASGNRYDCRFRDAAKIVVTGPSGCGKTALTVDLILHSELAFETQPTEVYVFYVHAQPAYEVLRDKCRVPVYLIEGPPDEDFRPTRDGACVVFDDLGNYNSSQISDFYLRKSHHYSTSATIHLTQNLFSAHRTNRDIHLNASYLILFRPRRDLGQLEKLNYSLLGRGHSNFLVDVFKALSSRGPYTYLLIDIEGRTPDAFKFRSSAVPASGETLVFRPRPATRGNSRSQDFSTARFKKG